MKKIIALVCMILPICAGMTSCGTLLDKETMAANKKFINAPFNPAEDRETFRVLILSNRYEVVQTSHKETIEREKDPGGDRYICDELKKYDKIDEAREGMYYVSLYPDRGTLQRVRPYKPLNLIELDNLVLDDLQRWSFQFPKNYVWPNNLYIKYRIVLRKRQSDKEIIREVEEKMMGDEEKR